MTVYDNAYCSDRFGFVFEAISIFVRSTYRWFESIFVDTCRARVG